MDIKTDTLLVSESTTTHIDQPAICTGQSESISAFNVVEEVGTTNKNLSKKAQRRLKKREKLLETRAEWRKAERLKKKQKRALQRQSEIDGDTQAVPKRQRITALSDSKCRINVGIDLSFDHLMNDKEKKQTITQLQYTYSVNRRSSNPIQLHFTSFTGETRQIFDGTLGTENWDVFIHEEPYDKVVHELNLSKDNKPNQESELVSSTEHDAKTVIMQSTSGSTTNTVCLNFDDETFSSPFARDSMSTSTAEDGAECEQKMQTGSSQFDNKNVPTEPDSEVSELVDASSQHLSTDAPLTTRTLPSVVYLTSESPNVLDELDPSMFYIIGGLVDHNSQKGLCYKLAQENGIGHARLPIDEFIVVKSRKVLTINHVFEILLRRSEGHTWEEALYHVIPKRKGVERITKDSKPEKADEQADNDKASPATSCS